MTLRRAVTLCALCAGVLFWSAPGSVAQGETHVTATTIVEVAPDTLKELLSTFEQAETATQARDLDGIMALYSEEYQYHGLKKADVRHIWKHLFDSYKELESFHTFSMIRRIGPASKLTAEMTCTGVIWGTSRQTSLRTPVDSWYEETHYLIKENGRWRIVGHAGGDVQPAMQFGIAPHPLF